MTLFVNKEADQMSEQLKGLINNFDKKEYITDPEIIKIKEAKSEADFPSKFNPKPLFENKQSNELSTKLNTLIDNFSNKLLSYKSPIDLAQKRESIPNALMLAGGIIATVGIPAGMMVGKYFNELAAGAGLAAIIPAGMMIGAGLIAYLNHVEKKEYMNNMDVDLPAKAKHNEKYGNDFLKKLDDLNIGDAFKEIKSIVDDSIKNPKEPQENAIIRIKSTIKKNNL
jgi:hypothetical protein